MAQAFNVEDESSVEYSAPLYGEHGEMYHVQQRRTGPAGQVCVLGCVIALGESKEIGGMVYTNTGYGRVEVRDFFTVNAEADPVATAKPEAEAVWGRDGGAELEFEAGTSVPCKVDDPIMGLIRVSRNGQKIQIRRHGVDAKFNYSVVCHADGMLWKLTPA